LPHITSAENGRFKRREGYDKKGGKSRKAHPVSRGKSGSHIRRFGKGMVQRFSVAALIRCAFLGCPDTSIKVEGYSRGDRLSKRGVGGGGGGALTEGNWKASTGSH